MRMSGSFVLPLGSERMWLNFETKTSCGTPYAGRAGGRSVGVLSRQGLPPSAV